MLRVCTKGLLEKQINLLVLLQFSEKLSTGVSQHGPNKSASIRTQAKVMGKLFGNRVAGSKKRWYPTHEVAPALPAAQMIKPSQYQGKNTSRRMTVLNKLFMKHITDLLATGETSEMILGRGLQISNVKISSDFSAINIFWSGGVENVEDNADLEQELQRCSGLLRHELSQLCLMGQVPRIHFVRDKKHINMNQVDRLLRNMDFGEDYAATDITDTVKRDFHWKVDNTEQVKEEQSSDQCPRVRQTPEMRHDVLGLDHRNIILKIHTKMRKSKQAWEQHETALASKESLSNDSTKNVSSENNLTSISQKLASAAAVEEQFDKFLLKRRERRNTPKRKKFQLDDPSTDLAATNAVIEQWNEDDDDFIYEEDNKKSS